MYSLLILLPRSYQPVGSSYLHNASPTLHVSSPDLHNTPMSFTLFSALPTELRLKVWDLSLPGRRIVAVTYTCAPASGSHGTPHEQQKRGCTSPTPIPGTLHVNRESRNEALLSYKLSFGIPHGRAKVFFNPALDVMYFGPRQGYLNSFKQFANACTMIRKDEMMTMGRLAVHADLFSQRNE